MREYETLFSSASIASSTWASMASMSGRAYSISEKGTPSSLPVNAPNIPSISSPSPPRIPPVSAEAPVEAQEESSSAASMSEIIAVSFFFNIFTPVFILAYHNIFAPM